MVSGGIASGWREGAAKYTGRAREDERTNPCDGGLLEQVQRPGDVGVNKTLVRMGHHVRLVESGGVNDGIHVAHASPHDVAVGDRANVIGERGGLDVEADRAMAHARQRPHQGLAEMPCASGDEDGHAAAEAPGCSIRVRR